MEHVVWQLKLRWLPLAGWLPRA